MITKKKRNALENVHKINDIEFRGDTFLGGQKEIQNKKLKNRKRRKLAKKSRKNNRLN